MKNLKALAKAIEKELTEKGLNVVMSWSTDSFSVHMYKNKYDYNTLTLKYLDNLSMEEYVAIILSEYVNNENIKEYKATYAEKMLVDLIDEFDMSGLFLIHDGELICDGFENGSIPIKDMGEINYCQFGDLLFITYNDYDLVYRYKIDMVKHTVTEIEES